MAQLSRWFNLNWRQRRKETDLVWNLSFLLTSFSLHVLFYIASSFPHNLHHFLSFVFLSPSSKVNIFNEFLSFHLTFFVSQNAAWCSSMLRRYAILIKLFYDLIYRKRKWWNKYLSRSRHTWNDKWLLFWLIFAWCLCLSLIPFILRSSTFSIDFIIFLLLSQFFIRNFLLVAFSSRTYQILSIARSELSMRGKRLSMRAF